MANDKRHGFKILHIFGIYAFAPYSNRLFACDFVPSGILIHVLYLHIHSVLAKYILVNKQKGNEKESGVGRLRQTWRGLKAVV